MLGLVARTDTKERALTKGSLLAQFGKNERGITY